MSDQPAQHAWPRLAETGLLGRLAIATGVLVLLGGYMVAGVFLAWHYDERDERPGLTLDDIRAQYQGVQSPSPLLEALKREHPEEGLEDPEREALIAWLEGPNLDRAYDDLDLGDMAPAEIMAFSCIDCHARDATGDDAMADMPLEYWDDVRPLAYSRNIQPTDREIIAMSQHTHAPSMAMVLIVLTLLAAMTRWPRVLWGGVSLIAGLALTADMAGWWLARSAEAWVYAIALGGAAHGVGIAVLGLLVIGDCLLPGGRRGSG